MPDSPHFPLEGRVVYPTIEFFINGMQTSSHYSVRYPVLPISFFGLYIHCSSLFSLSIFSASSSSAIPIPKTGIRFLSAHIVHPRCAHVARFPPHFGIRLVLQRRPSLTCQCCRNKEREKLMGNNW